MSPKETYNKLIITKTIENLEKRNMQGYYAKNKEEALSIALSLIKENSVVSWGGSLTLNEIGILDKLKQGNYTCLDRDLAASPEEKDKIQRETFFADYFLMSTNAITIDGELINIDGLGNRVSALIFGPKNVLIIAGINKIAENLDVALSRAKNTAGVTNAIRFNCNTPCTKTGKCHSCTSNDTVCCQYVHTKFSKIKNRIKVILVEENLGF